MTKIYLTDLEAYNNGHLIGEWIELPSSNLEDDIARVLEMGRTACNDSHKHEEYFITDYECNYKKIEEYEDLFELQVTAERIEALTDDEQTAVKLMIENYIVNDIEDAIDHLDDMRNTNETKMEDIAYNYVNDCGLLEAMPESMQCYFDYESLGRDMEINGNFYEDQDGLLWEYVA